MNLGASPALKEKSTPFTSITSIGFGVTFSSDRALYRASAKQVVPLFPTIMVRLSICFPFNVSDRSFENSFPSTVFKKTEYIYIAPDSKVVNFGVAAIYWLSSEYQNATGSRYPCAFVSSFSQRS